MDFSFANLHFSNLNQAGFAATEFCIIGMAVVFAGLTMIAVYISLLPIAMKGASRLKKKIIRRSPGSRDDGTTANGVDDETLLAITTALHLYQSGDDDNRKITWKRHELWDSSWQRAGRFEAMNNQGNTLAQRR